MKKFAISIVVLSIALLSVFALVACGSTDTDKSGDPSESVVITDPNDFVKSMETAKDFTFYQYDENGDLLLTAGVNSDGEMMMIKKKTKSFVVKEGDKLVVYNCIDGVWSKKTNDEATAMITQLKTEIDDLSSPLSENYMGKITKAEDGYWYSENIKNLGFKMEDGKLVAYSKETAGMVKFVVIELKVNVVLPEEAKNAVEA